MEIKSASLNRQKIMTTINNMPLRRADYRIVAVSSMEQLIGGALATVIGVMLPMIHLLGHPHMSSGLQGFVGATGLIGIGIGGLLIGRVIDRRGYLLMFRLCPVLMLIGCAVCFFLTSIAGLIAGLLLIGIGVGGGYALDSGYISELMPDKWREVMVGIAKATSSLGFIGGAVACYFMLKAAPYAETWNRMILVIAALALITLLMRIKWYESPEWLKNKGETAKAQQALTDFVGPGITIDATTGAAAPAQKQKFSVRANWSRIIFSGIPWACEGMGVYGFSVFLPVLVMALGLNFDSSSAHGIDKVIGSVEVTAAVNFFILPGFIIGLCVLRRLNNVKMMCSGFVLSAIGLLLLLGAYMLHWPAWVMLVAFIIYEISLNAGPHLVTFVIPAKIYPVAVRGQGTGIADIMGKAGAVIGVIVMPMLLQWGGMALVLSVSAAVMLTGAAVGLIYGKKLQLI